MRYNDESVIWSSSNPNKWISYECKKGQIAAKTQEIYLPEFQNESHSWTYLNVINPSPPSGCCPWHTFIVHLVF